LLLNIPATLLNLEQCRGGWQFELSLFVLGLKTNPEKWQTHGVAIDLLVHDVSPLHKSYLFSLEKAREFSLGPFNDPLKKGSGVELIWSSLKDELAEDAKPGGTGLLKTGAVMWFKLRSPYGEDSVLSKFLFRKDCWENGNWLNDKTCEKELGDMLLVGCFSRNAF
jgi:hypothetical protein